MRDDARPGIRDVKTLYAWVIEDVVTRMRSEFLQEGLDESVLHELRQVWEEKLEESGAFKTDEGEEPAITGRQEIRQLFDDAGDEEEDTPLAMKQEQEAATKIKTEEVIPSFTNPAHMAHKRKGDDSAFDEAGVSKRPFLDLNEPYIKQADGAVDLNDPWGLGEPYIKQADGAADLDEPLADDGVNSQTGLTKAGLTKAAQLSTLAGLTCLAGLTESQCSADPTARLFKALGLTRSDHLTESAMPIGSESSGDPVSLITSDDLTLTMPACLTKQLFIRQTDGPEDGLADDEDLEEEQPLNEDDDLNDDDDDEDQEDEDKATNFLCAQYEKVNRIKNKWKCQLKDGVFNINGRDYAFRKASTEFQF